MGDVTCIKAKKDKPLLASKSMVRSLDFILSAVVISLFLERF